MVECKRIATIKRVIIWTIIPIAFLLLREGVAATGAPPAVVPESVLDGAERALAGGNIRGAGRLLAQARAGVLARPLARRLETDAAIAAAYGHIVKGRLRPAEASLKAAAPRALNGFQVEAIGRMAVVLGQAWARAKRPNDGSRVLNEVTKLIPSERLTPRFFVLTAGLRVGLNKPAEAFGDLSRAFGLMGKEVPPPEWVALMKRTLPGLSKALGAEKALGRMEALEAAPAAAERLPVGFFFFKVQVLTSLKRLDAIRPVLGVIAARDAGPETARRCMTEYLALARAYGRAGDAAGARWCMTRAERLVGKCKADARLLLDYAAAAQELEMGEVAAAVLRQAADLKVKDPNLAAQVAVRYAEALAAVGRTQQAVAVLWKKRVSVPLLLHVARTALRRSEQDFACETARLALASKPKPAERKRAEAVVARVWGPRAKTFTYQAQADMALAGVLLSRARAAAKAGNTKESAALTARARRLHAKAGRLVRRARTQR